MAPQIVAAERRTETCYLRCDECRTPVAEIRGGYLVIKAKHHGGVTHTTVIPIRELLAAMERAA